MESDSFLSPQPFFLFSLLTVDAEQVSSLGSEGEDEVGLWSLEPQDCQESLDKTSLTPSEGTEEPGSPSQSTRPQSLSPGSRNYWAQVEPETEVTEDGTAVSATDREGDQEPMRMYCKLDPYKTNYTSVLFENCCYITKCYFKFSTVFLKYSVVLFLSL